MNDACKTLTLFIRSVLHFVGAIAKIIDKSFSEVAWWVVDASLDVITSRFGESTSVYCEICRSLPENS